MIDFKYKKKYGQNFLQDKNVINNICNSIDATADDLVIEIGPGSGVLTKYIKEIGCKYVGYEIDLDVKKYLESYESTTFQFIYDDFLKRDVIADINNIKYKNLYIVGNLPYYITTPILLKIIEANINVTSMVFMVQKEVADRFSASVGTREYGSISVLLNYFYDIEKLFVVGKNCFYPVPNVDSAVIKLVSKNDRLDVDIVKFNKLVRDAFQFKRKNIRNNLRGYNLADVENILIKYGYSLNNRAEELSYEVYVDITNNI